MIWFIGLIIWLWFGVIAAIAYLRECFRGTSTRMPGFSIFLIAFGLCSAIIALMMGAYKWQVRRKASEPGRIHSWLKRTADV